MSYVIFHDIMIWGGCVHRVAQVRPLELALERPMDQWAGCLHVRILENPQDFSESEINTWTFWILNDIDIGIFKMAKWYAKYFRYFENVLICPNPSTFLRSTSQFLGGHVQDAVRGVCISGQKCKRQTPMPSMPWYVMIYKVKPACICNHLPHLNIEKATEMNEDNRSHGSSDIRIFDIHLTSLSRRGRCCHWEIWSASCCKLRRWRTPWVSVENSWKFQNKKKRISP